MQKNREGHYGQTSASESQRLDCVYDNEPLGYEKDPLNLMQKMQAQDPLEEVDLGDGVTKRPTYISMKVGSNRKTTLLGTCEISGLSRSIVEHRFPIQQGKKPVKQHPRRFTPEIT